MITVTLLVFGLVVLAFGAEMFIRGSARFAADVGISPLVIGLTIVAFGTSAPEMVVSVLASLHQKPDIAVGNVVGSNICNVLLILGCSALALPLSVSRQVIRWDLPVMIFSAVLLWTFCTDGQVSRSEAAVLFICLIVYTISVIRLGKQGGLAPLVHEYQEKYAEKGAKNTKIFLHLGYVLLGVLILIAGSRLLVTQAITLARLAGISELLIGLTIVAIGTSLPELATSLIATLKGERDIAIGNVIGSSLFNTLGILGASGVLAKGGLSIAPALLAIDLPFMVAISFLSLPLLMTGMRISRWEGGLFLGYYTVYLAYLALEAMHSEFADSLRAVFILWMIPVTGLMILFSIWNSMKEKT